jgi:diguanylate cyclase (GGDEF)-like protein
MDVKMLDSDAAIASAHFGRAAALAGLPEQTEELAGYGRWWIERSSSRIALSVAAARHLSVRPGVHAALEACGARVVADDLPPLAEALRQAAATGAPIDCAFRLIDPLDGVRWLRMLSMRSASAPVVTGVLTDITSAKHAAMREKFSFALTQYLIGTDTLDEAVTRIIQLVCEDLGWEWGAYWELDRGGADEVLLCRHSWHGMDQRLAPFKRYSEALDMLPDKGLVGRVWRTGQPEWIDARSTDPGFVRGQLALECGLQSGYMFPVTYVTPDGVLHRPGVLEFFSKLPRQREAQLPNLSASIGALIALTAQRMIQQERIRRLALSDEMTGLANRNHFHTLLDAACRSIPPRRPFGVLYIDLDQFKPINDAFGHQAGNVVLSEFARRLQALVPAGCAIGRLGGDEFAILCTPEITLAGLDALAHSVLKAARERFSYGAHELSVSASIGISRFPAHGTSTADLLHAADAAMYLSKRNGRNLASHFSADGLQQQIDLAGQLTLLSELHHAHARNEFFLEYQPIFDSDQRVVAVEALIRWRKPNGEIVPPDVFIPIAEQSRLIVHLGRWVVEQACRDVPLIHAAGMPDVQVHVNMAAPEFIDTELPAQLMAILQKAGVQPRHICLELTEGVVMSVPEKTVPVMRELQRLGFEISLDDFGMGYSSLSMLKRLPISSFKIDRLFVGGVPRDRQDCAIVRAILDLGRNLNMRVIAEGVECDAQLGFLRQFDCQIQGYLLGRPVTLERLIALYGKSSFQP